MINTDIMTHLWWFVAWMVILPLGVLVCWLEAAASNQQTSTGRQVSSFWEEWMSRIGFF
jgi:uncharacterized oligopeptide transporter (OPT) family protein